MSVINKVRVNNVSYTLGDSSNIAQNYDATQTYALGDHCIYTDGLLYKCTTAITVAEAWNAAHWTRAMAVDASGGGKIIQDPNNPSRGIQVQGTNAAIDATLSLQGYAADAKATGDALDEQSAEIAELSDMIAPLYDATATYALNALCIHENKLYKCTTAIETAEEWTAEHWTQTTLAALINA